MGLLVSDQIAFINGLTLNNFVVSIKGNIREIQKINTPKYDEENNITYDTVYRLFYVVWYYANEMAYNTNSEPIDKELHQLDIKNNDINGDLFGLIYNNIKSSYQYTTNI